MSGGSELKSESAIALREAGFVPLPRLWVKKEDLDLIYFMAQKYSDEVSEIRAEALERKKIRLRKEREMELAWQQREALNEQEDEV